jgi:hypothetical protein
LSFHSEFLFYLHEAQRTGSIPLSQIHVDDKAKITGLRMSTRAILFLKQNRRTNSRLGGNTDKCGTAGRDAEDVAAGHPYYAGLYPGGCFNGAR